MAVGEPKGWTPPIHNGPRRSNASSPCTDQVIFVRYGPVDSLLGMLSNSVGRPVVDNTGLIGLYDIDLRFAPEMDPRLADVGGTVPVDDVSVFTAVREQLGLNLQPREDEVRVLVVADIQSYAFDYKQGGWENDLKAVFERHFGSKLGRE